MIVRVRCSRKCCQKRRTLEKHPEEYFKFSRKLGAFVNKAPECEGCGNNNYRVDNWRHLNEIGVASCSCSGYVHLTKRIWPHRQGSKYCWFRKDGTQRMEGDSDFHDSQMEEYIYNQKRGQ